MTITVFVDAHDGGTDEVELEGKFEVCPSCRGRGASMRYLGAMTADEWDEMDSEWQDDYIARRFDRPCDECHGQRVVEVPDRDRWAPEHLAAWEEQQRDLAEVAAIERMERMVGA